MSFYKSILVRERPVSPRIIQRRGKIREIGPRNIEAHQIMDELSIEYVSIHPVYLDITC